MKFEKDDYVEWNWGQGTAFGKVLNVHLTEVTKTIKTQQVTRKASESKPAYYIAQIDEDSRVLKSHSEVKGVTKKSLLKFAQDLKVKGRSKMTRDQLLQAVT